MKFRIIFTLLLISHFFIYAQKSKEISLVDAKTNNTITNASILNKTINRGTTSNTHGSFQIIGSPKDTIIITHINYMKRIFILKDIPKLIYLQPNETRLNEVAITTHRKKISTINKLSVKDIDLPLITNAISAGIMEERNPTDLGDALKSATGVRPINRYGGFQTFRIRGFNNFVLLVDGVRDERHNLSTSAPSTNLANVERIEVLKGPASVLLGHSALGGVINIIRKKPTYFQTGNFNVTYGSFDTYKMSLGIGGPISKNLHYRTDFGITRSSGWRAFGVVTNNGSLMFDYQLTKNDRIEIYLQANNDQYDTDTGIPVDDDGSLIEGMNPETRYNDPQDYLKHKRIDTQLKYTHHVNEKLSFSNHFSLSDDNIDYLSTEFLELNKTRDTLTRSFPFYFNHKTFTLQNQLDLNYNFSTGTIKHKSLFGYSLSLLKRKSFRGDVIGSGAFTSVAIQNPILNQGNIEPIDKKVNVREELVNAIYFQNWMKFSDQLKALVGLRYDIFSGTYYVDQLNPDRTLLKSGEQTSIPSTVLTYRLGAVYQPIKYISLFTSYSNYFKPSRTIAPNGAIFDPEKGFQVELGIKWEKPTLISASISGFYLVKNNIVERNAMDEFNQIGEADSRGIELDLHYVATQGLNIKGGYAYVDAKVRAFDKIALQVTRAGNKLRFSPEHIANLWISYGFQNKILKGLGCGSGVNYTGSNYTDSANSFELPSYYNWDATIFYKMKAGIRIAFNLNNITNQLYFTDAIYGNQFFPGMGCNFKLSLGYQF